MNSMGKVFFTELNKFPGLFICVVVKYNLCQIGNNYFLLSKSGLKFLKMKLIYARLLSFI